MWTRFLSNEITFEPHWRDKLWSKYGGPVQRVRRFWVVLKRWRNLQQRVMWLEDEREYFTQHTNERLAYLEAFMEQVAKPSWGKRGMHNVVTARSLKDAADLIQERY